jgi:hypothetical protein
MLMRKVPFGQAQARIDIYFFMAWDKFCKPYEKGGLNIRNIERINEVMILKLV